VYLREMFLNRAQLLPQLVSFLGCGHRLVGFRCRSKRAARGPSIRKAPQPESSSSAILSRCKATAVESGAKPPAYPECSSSTCRTAEPSSATGHCSRSSWACSVVSGHTVSSGRSCEFGRPHPSKELSGTLRRMLYTYAQYVKQPQVLLSITCLPILQPCHDRRNRATAVGSPASTCSSRRVSLSLRSRSLRSAWTSWRPSRSAISRACIKSRQPPQWTSQEERSNGFCKADDSKYSTPSSTGRPSQSKNLSMCTFALRISEEVTADGTAGDVMHRSRRVEKRQNPPP